MADDKTKKATEAKEVSPPMPRVVAQSAKTVGDENMKPREPQYEVNQDSVPAQVMGKPEDASDTVPVHEVYVSMDSVITDANDPLAVQIPDAGRGDASLPIHGLAGKTPEQYFADGGDKS